MRGGRCGSGHVNGGRLSLSGGKKKRDPYARVKNAAVGYLVGRSLGGNNGGLVGAAFGGIGNLGFFKGGKKRSY